MLYEFKFMCMSHLVMRFSGCGSGIIIIIIIIIIVVVVVVFAIVNTNGLLVLLCNIIA
jgi:hypothetical protein